MNKQKEKYNLNDKQYQWDLNLILDKNEKPAELINQWYKTKLQLYKASKDLYRSSAKLLSWIKLYLQVDKLDTRIHVFLQCKNDNAPKATKWKSLINKYDQLEKKMAKHIVPFKSIILNHEKQIKKLLQQPQLKEYKRIFDTEFFVLKNHLPSSADRRTIDIMQSDKAIDLIHSGIIDDCRRAKPHATNSKGKIVEADSYTDLFRNDDPEIRKSAFENFYWQYYTRKETYAALLYVHSYRSTQKARMYNFKTDMHWDMHSEYELEMDQFFDIVNQASIFKDLYIRYKDHRYGIVNHIFNIHQTQPWDKDLWLNINKHEYTPQEAKQIVYESFKCFGPEITKITNDILHSKLIKWTSESNENDKHGSFTIGGLGKLQKEPIQITFRGDAFSVMTLAHEIGHSIALYYSKHHQKTYSALPKLLSEIPSTVCELVCGFYLWSIAKTNSDKLVIIDTLLSTFFFNVSQYAAFTIFKEKLNWRFYNDGAQKAGDILAGHYHFLKKCAGLSKIENHWLTSNDYPQWLLSYEVLNKLYIDHYDNSGIKYYIGQTVAWLVAVGIHYNHNKQILNSFLKFIKTGGSKKPLNQMKILRINLLNKQTYKMAKQNLIQVLRSYETFPTLNKPGSTRFGKYNEFDKQTKKGDK